MNFKPLDGESLSFEYAISTAQHMKTFNQSQKRESALEEKSLCNMQNIWCFRLVYYVFGKKKIEENLAKGKRKHWCLCQEFVLVSAVMSRAPPRVPVSSMSSGCWSSFVTGTNVRRNGQCEKKMCIWMRNSKYKPKSVYDCRGLAVTVQSQARRTRARCVGGLRAIVLEWF